MDSKPIILYHYTFSPYSKRVEWYLILRGIPYYQCMQPIMMPRPDVEKLGINYRRIPIVSIGKDVYLDTRLQLPALEALFPDIPKLGFTPGQESEQYALQHLLSTLTTDSGVFETAASLIPSDTPMLQDPKWQKDRKNYFPQGDMSKETMDRAKPGAELEMARTFRLLEGILQDDRSWIANGNRPSLADIEAIWPVIFTMNIPGALPSDKFSKEIFPKVYAWVDRFQAALGTAQNHQEKAPKLEGDEAAKKIAQAEYNSKLGGVDTTDSVVKHQSLQAGDEVEVWPIDTGSLNRDRGKLLCMNVSEVVFEVKGENGLTRVHAPRHGFRIKKTGDATKL